MKVYIAGKISGDPEYRAKFALASYKIRKGGDIPLDPSVLPDGMEPQDYMQICLAMLYAADAVYFLRDYIESRGAAIEHRLAKYNGKKIYYETNGAYERVER